MFKPLAIPNCTRNCTGTITPSTLSDQWHILLAHHQDQQLALDGIQHGIRIGFNWGTPLCSARQNIQSTYDHPEVVDKYITSKLSKGHLIGPLPTA